MTEEDRPAFETRAADWLPVLDAQRRILAACHPLPGEEVPLTEALGRALAEDLIARAALPPWDNAAMDGYAVRGADVAGATPADPKTLAVSGRLRAGARHPLPLAPGGALRIMTGAPVPPGADSVIRVEDTDAEASPGQVRVLHDRDVRRNVRPAGEDFRPGDVVLRSGQPIHAGTVGVLASLGLTRVRVGQRPRVTILTTGDELVGPERYQEVVEGSGVPESNGPMLAAAVAAAGGIATVLGPVPDDLEALAAAIQEARGAHAMVTVGGASMGEADLVKRALDRGGFVQDFWRVAMRPGSPFSFGWLPGAPERTPVFGLPGNPASAYVTFEVLVRPCLLRMAGHARVHRRRVTATAAAPLQGSGHTQFVRVRLHHQGALLVAEPAGPQGSGLSSGLAHVEALAVLPAGASVAPGHPVDTILLDPGPSAAFESPLSAMTR